jgi:hypothetical protein
MPAWVFLQTGRRLIIVNAIHQPGPAFRRTCAQPVIAADQGYTKYAGYVQDYVDAGVMPMVASPDRIHDHYLAEPIYFVGWQPADSNKWVEYIHYMDGFGEELHGTVHGDCSEPNGGCDRIATLLGNPIKRDKDFGDNCFAKNGVLVVIGTRMV